MLLPSLPPPWLAFPRSLTSGAVKPGSTMHSLRGSRMNSLTAGRTMILCGHDEGLIREGNSSEATE
ncbi:hypothetical protein C8Q80DRAFT_1141273 [Daedaleopsis nitida]|nr:hypothetical protein C8Q80DRAFT_1141273 [Daedaleopsis nitida]